jgi:hypothetical protein
MMQLIMVAMRVKIIHLCGYLIKRLNRWAILPSRQV